MAAHTVTFTLCFPSTWNWCGCCVTQNVGCFMLLHGYIQIKINLVRKKNTCFIMLQFHLIPCCEFVFFLCVCLSYSEFMQHWPIQIKFECLLSWSLSHPEFSSFFSGWFPWTQLHCDSREQTLAGRWTTFPVPYFAFLLKLLRQPKRGASCTRKLERVICVAVTRFVSANKGTSLALWPTATRQSSAILLATGSRRSLMRCLAVELHCPPSKTVHYGSNSAKHVH